MYLVTKTQMQNIDRHAIEKICIPGNILMENAGIKIFEILKKQYLNFNPAETKICIFAGIGNNGGDGLVLARHLLNHRYKTTIAVIGSPIKMSKETLINYEILKNLNAKILIIKKSSGLSYLKQIIKDSNILIDALLGTGLSRPVEGLTGEVIELINNSGKKVISVDIPSGIDADTGEVLGVAVKANHTITMALPKRGQFLFPGKNYSGKISVVDISIPYEAIKEKINTQIFLRKNKYTNFSSR
ncbi:NAD(P)H-hydrate epimerase [Candidatus Desantisbacteria bacterium]|nr:NAD(P)H-hydrate epimerase [Candidatus Desantisbacteria bacterium]